MPWILLLLGALFTGIGFVVTEKNAKYLLAGYNTLAEKEREKIDLSAFLVFFRRFHIFLGLSFVLLGTGIFLTADALAVKMFISLYPLLAYLFFAWKSQNYRTGTHPGNNK